MSELTPYDPTLIGTTPAHMIKTTLESGSEVYVGLQRDHVLGVTFYHEFRNAQPDGKRSQLKFALSPEACRALVQLYMSHGLLPELTEEN